MKIDVLIFGGQSNMQGQTESIPQPNHSIENAMEYKYLTDMLISLKHPVGEDVEEDLLWRAGGGKGSLVPDFCRVYTEESGCQVVAIHASRGDTKISEWLKGTPRYECACKKINAGIAKAKELGEIRHIYYIWLQGESDALNCTSEKEYIDMLVSYKDDLKNDVGIEKFCIIEVGYYCSYWTYFVQDYTWEDSRKRDETIMRAQERVVEKDEDFVMLTQICKVLTRNPEYINPHAGGHYNNKAMKIIGIEAGKRLASLSFS